MDAAPHTEGLRECLLAMGAEAAAVLAHPEVEAALEAGGGERLRGALLRVRAAAASQGEATLIDRMLANRGLFLERGRGAPLLGRALGTGTALREVSDREADGSHGATLFVTLAYVPVLPLSSWRVRPTRGGGWRYLGRLPLRRAHRIWRWAVGGCVAVAILLGRGHARAPADGRPTLHVVNALEIPLTIVVGGTTRALAARAVASMPLPPGTHAARATGPTLETVETLDVTLAADDRFYVWNLLGAAPLRILTFEYVNRLLPDVESRPPTAEDFSGASFFVSAPVQYPFVEPPEELRMSDVRTTRRRAVVLSGGLETACALLEDAWGAPAAADLASRVALASKDDPSIAQAAERARGDRVRLRAFADRAVAVAPDSVEAHRIRQDAWILDGRREEALALYRRNFEAKPRDPDAAYLHARLLPSAEALPRLHAALLLHPLHARLLRAAAHDHFVGGTFSAAVAAFDRLQQVDAAMAREGLWQHARALVGCGRVRDAQRLALAAAQPGAFDALVAYVRLRALPASDPSLPPVVDVLSTVHPDPPIAPGSELVLAALARDGDWFDRVAASARDLDPTHRDVARVVLLASTDLPSAADLAASLPPEAFADPSALPWDAVTRVSVACELVRTGRTELARRSFDAAATGGVLTWDRMGDPAQAARDEDLDLEVRAALLHAAARATSDPAARAHWLERARAFDLLGTVVPRDAR